MSATLKNKEDQRKLKIEAINNKRSGEKRILSIDRNLERVSKHILDLIITIIIN